MTVSTQICKRIYQADGNTRVWELDFPVLSAEDVQVFMTGADGTETKLSSGYEINLSQATATYPTEASGQNVLAPGEYITLVRSTPLTQEINLTQQGVLDAEELENGYDKLTLQVQELAEQTQRCIQYPVSSVNAVEDAQGFLDKIQETQTAGLQRALETVEETKMAWTQSLTAETTNRETADLSLQQQIQTLAGLLAQQTSTLSVEQTVREQTDSDLNNRLNQLNFIQFVPVLPACGDGKYIYAVAQDETDLDDNPIVILYIWDSLATVWNAVGAFSTNLDPASLLSKTEAAGTYETQTHAVATYVPLTQKAAANGVATLDANGQIAAGQINYATSARVGGIKQSFDATTGTWTVITEEA